MIEIDGTYGEGGGQILRTSIALSAITGMPLTIHNIRGKRSKPGLQAQHLTCVRAAAEICGAKLSGDAVGSVQLKFEPQHSIRAGEYEFDIGTAGSTTLVAQTVLVPLALADDSSRVTIRGGTHNPMAPTADYLEHVFLPMAAMQGLRASVEIRRFGFYPKGGGEIKISVEPSKFQPVHFDHTVGENNLKMTIASCGIPQEFKKRAEDHLNRLLDEAVEVVDLQQGGPSQGVGLTLIASDEMQAGFSSLGERGKRLEKVIEEAVTEYKTWKETGAPVDPHLADQLVLPALFAEGRTSYRVSEVTEHLQTVLWLAEHFLPLHYSLDDEAGTVTILRP